MAEEKNKQNEQQPKKRGRPRKEDQTPVVNEAPVEGRHVEMSEKGENQTIEKLMASLTGLYKRMFSDGTIGLGNIYDINKYNPFLQNQRLKMISSLPGKMDRESLSKALAEPQNNEQSLRSEGWAMSSQQYMYYKILRLACDVPLYKWYLTPEFLEKAEYEKEDFVNEDAYVNEWMENFDVVNTLKRVALEVKREGKPTYVLRNSVDFNGKKRKVNFATWQKLPSNYVKLVKIGTHGYIASFNMLIFLNPAFSTEQYPEFIQDIWNDMINNGVVYSGNSDSDKGRYLFDVDAACNYSYNYRGDSGATEMLSSTIESVGGKRLERALKSSYMFWVQLPQDLCYTFCSDASNVWSIPDTAGLLLALDELADYDTLQGLIESTPLTALLTAEADMINDPNPGQDQTSLNPETIWGLQDKFNELTSTNLEAFFAPLKNFKLLSLPAQPNGSEISANATKNVITRAGLGGLMITTDKPSVSQVKAAQLLAESEADYVTRQFESVLNMIINNLIGCRYKWKLHIWGNIFTFSDEFSRDKEMFVAGASFVLPKLISAYGMTIKEAKAAQNYIESVKLYDDFKTITQKMQQENQENKEQSGKVGRPAKSDDDVDNDNTAASKDGGLDTSDTRSYSSRRFERYKCIICGSDCDGVLCEECREKYEGDL